MSAVGDRHRDQRSLVDIALDQLAAGDADLEVAQRNVRVPRLVGGDVRDGLERYPVRRSAWTSGSRSHVLHLRDVGLVVAFDAVGPAHGHGEIDALIFADREIDQNVGAAAGLAVVTSMLSADTGRLANGRRSLRRRSAASA